jgi:hypothetical protein
MIWCETAAPDARAMERLAVFVSQVNALGLEAGIDVRAVPGGLHRSVRFDIAPYLLDRPLERADQVVLIAADQMTDAKLVELRRLLGGEPRACIAFGRFGRRQQLIGAKAKLSYIFNRDPTIIDLGERGSPGSGLGGDPVFGAPRRLGAWRGAMARPRLMVAHPSLDDVAQVAALTALALSQQVELAVLTDGEAKKAWQAARGSALPIYNYGEILPFDLAERMDILACMTPLQANYRLQCLVANAATAGVVLLDCTPDHATANTIDAFIRAPWELIGLTSFLGGEVLPNLGQLQAHTRASVPRSWSGTYAKQVFEAQSRAGSKLSRPIAAVRRSPEPPARLVFVPTNGVGLGHAQRCTLVAAELDRTRVDPVFAAFPSCIGLVKDYGFDVMPLVQRSPLHLQTYENDLPNYVRLKALTTKARALVFDGGYVFDSIYRTIVENRLAGVWLRRGLWQGQQDNSIALDRAKMFARIIVPTEAFDELNDHRSWSERAQHVGPIVRRHSLDSAGRDRLRHDLALRYDLSFDRLVVTQLGGGVAADRGPQVQALCGIMERRSDVLHLVVVWPTAVVQPGWSAWSRSRVVRTRHAGVLAAAADLCISAAGYNSFHEILYGALPAILMPQMGKGMDDQMARAGAARNRDLVGVVEPHQLMAVDRLVTRFLDAGEATAAKQRLAALELPPPGNSRAAALIEELMNEGTTLAQSRVADRSAEGR